MSNPSEFAHCLPVILAAEGGKVDDPRDPGGRTNQGITQDVYDAFRKRRGMSTRDVYLMTSDERDSIYRSQYWNAVRGDDLRPGVALAVFDVAVNSGPVRAIKLLQRAVGVDVDGHLGEVTMAAVKAAPDDDLVVDAICDGRLDFLRTLKTWKTFGKGWSRRVEQVRTLGEAWATGSIGGPVVAVPDGGAKAHVEDMKKPPAVAPGDVATGVGVSSLGLAPTVKTLQDTITPYASSGGWVMNLVIGLAVVGAVLTIGGLVWRFVAANKRKQMEA